MEMRCGWRANGHRSRIPVDLIVDKAPLLEESMNSHDCTDVASQVTSTSRARQILGWIQTVRVDHEVSISQVNLDVKARRSTLNAV